ncbi:DUF5336 domain-containing protein [Streptomyces phaeofaciens JCM 4814]|uniref:Uncharacterized protein n=1 Tax=Streptomyces phaeofaciens TaxID=68254 RepID=A0A918HJR2_9ACTN|nr:DUF5336 domain-containing protein [Streptomyces phaeofaciens]GGT72762.1 hypothetical protein GCM10010226_58510 [Streptomyces phaeofaciens]
MNIRSLTRGDGVVIGAAVLLFIASFLDNYSYDGVPDSVDMPSLWSSGPVLLSVVLAGLIGAALVVVARGLPQPRKVVGLELGPFGVAFALFAAWSALGNVIDPVGAVDNIGSGSDSGAPDAGTGLILALVATLVMAGAAIATPLVPALQAGLVPAPKPPTPQPYGAQPPAGYGYPGAPQPSAFGGQPQAPGQPPFGAQPGAAQPSAQDFSPFWFAVPVPRPLYGEDGAPMPIAELAPGTWYLAVEQGSQGLVAQTQDGRRGVLRDSSGIQRG